MTSSPIHVDHHDPHWRVRVGNEALDHSHHRTSEAAIAARRTDPPF